MSTLLKIDGMTCQNCAHHVREALVKLAGVEGAGDGDGIGCGGAGGGGDAGGLCGGGGGRMTSELKIGGMTCANCARHVREALQEVPGVQYAEVDLEAGRASVTVRDEESADDAELVAAVGRAGYAAERIENGKAESGASKPEARGVGDFFTWKVNVIAGLGVAAVLMGVEYLLRPGMEGWCCRCRFFAGGSFTWGRGVRRWWGGLIWICWWRWDRRRRLR